jgi:hypothetical protein
VYAGDADTSNFICAVSEDIGCIDRDPELPNIVTQVTNLKLEIMIDKLVTYFFCEIARYSKLYLDPKIRNGEQELENPP